MASELERCLQVANDVDCQWDCYLANEFTVPQLRAGAADSARLPKEWFQEWLEEVGPQKSTVTLYRPVGPAELELVRSSGNRSWPPRLPGQPIFYPVTNEQYAAEIATRWNTKDDGVGYVTRFEVNVAFMNRYQVQKVGAKHHTEWWVPAEDLEELNQNIVGQIEVIGEYRAVAPSRG